MVDGGRMCVGDRENTEPANTEPAGEKRMFASGNQHEVVRVCYS